MAIKELFYDQRPIALLDPRGSNRIDPRFKISRSSAASYVDSGGTLRIVGPNQPVIDYDPTTGAARGLLLEPQRTNRVRFSDYAYYYNFGASVAVAQNTQDVISPTGEYNATKVTGTGGVYQSYVEGTNTTGVLSFFAKKGNTKYIRYWGSGVGLNNSNIGPTSDNPIYSYRFAVFNLDTGEITGGGAYLWNMVQYRNGWWRISAKYTTNSQYAGSSFGVYTLADTSPNYSNPVLTNTVYVFGFSYEVGDYITSYIRSPGNADTTRTPTLLSLETPIPFKGSVYVDAQAGSIANNNTLISLKNASNQKVNLAMESRTETYNSLALINSYSGTAKSSLPLPVPTTNRERNIITWGANNYQYTKDSSRFAPSLSTSVPANLTSLSIGHDSVDPTKAFNGYINSVYLYSGEIAPAVAEALVRGELDPVNADTYSPAGPTGSLSLIINTQGASSSGDKVFALPAESAANDNNLTITWGDGTESALELAAAEVGAAGLSHTYPSAGIYPVWVEGKMQNLYFNNSASAPDLLSIASWGTGQMFTSPSTMVNAFYGCSKMDFSASARTTNLPDTSLATNWSQAFYNCSSITGTFPSLNFSAATNFSRTWSGCGSMTAFTAAGNQTQNVTNFFETWQGCAGLTSFPLINTSAGTSFDATWRSCSSLTSFPLINTSAATNLSRAWQNCSGLAAFPLLNTSSCVSFGQTWRDCSSLTSFPLINTSSATDFYEAWYGCNSLTSFPLLDTEKVSNFTAAWLGCSSLTSFPLINTAAGTIFDSTWRSCSGLTSFPSINTAAGTNFSATWFGCSGLTSFPLINTGAGTNFSFAWQNCSSLTTFPALDFDSATGLASDASSTYTGFRETWYSCDALANFPANLFNNTTCTRYLDAFRDCALTAASIENIIVSINAAGTSNGNLSLQGGTNAGASTWTANAVTAYNALVARGWTITRNA